MVAPSSEYSATVLITSNGIKNFYMLKKRFMLIKKNEEETSMIKENHIKETVTRKFTGTYATEGDEYDYAVVKVGPPSYDIGDYSIHLKVQGDLTKKGIKNLIKLLAEIDEAL